MGGTGDVDNVGEEDSNEGGSADEGDGDGGGVG